MLRVTHLSGFASADFEVGPASQTLTPDLFSDADTHFAPVVALIDPTTDPDIASVELLVAFNGTDGATTAADEGPDGRTLTFVGNAQIDTAQSKFGGSSLLLDGTGDKVTAPDSTDWDVSGDFTFECWARWNTRPSTATIMAHAVSSISYGWWLQSNNAGTIRFRYDDNGDGVALHDISSSSAVSTGQWYHIAVDRDSSNKLRMYINGVMVASKTGATGTAFNAAATLDIGQISSSFGFDGWLNEVRITRGVARYASDGGFTPRSTAFPRV